MDRKVLLMILDGWGEGRHDHSNAIYTAKVRLSLTLSERNIL